MQIHGTWRIGDAAPFEVEAPPEEPGPMVLTPVELQEETYRTWTPAWRDEEQARLRGKVSEMMAKL